MTTDTSFRWSALTNAVLFALLLVAPCSARAQADAGSSQPPPADAGAPAPELVAPSLLEGVTPEYPSGQSGSASVVLELTLDATGAVTQRAVIESAGPAFDSAALSAAERLRFTPATRDGVAIPALIPFRFTFEPPPPPPPPPPPAPAPSPEPAPPPPLIGTVELEIRAAPPAREVTRQSLAPAEVRAIPGTNGDVLRSVETLPGVARPAPLDGELLVLRGAAPEDSQVYVDGTSIPLAYHLGGISAVVPGDVLERLDYYPGNFGPQYGRAMGGVIDVGLRSPRRDRLGALLQVDMIDARGLIETPIGEHTGVLLAFRRSWMDLWFGPVLEGSGGTSVRTAPVYWDGQAIVEQDLTESTRARLSVFGSDDRFEILIEEPSAQDPVLSGKLGFGLSFVRTQLRLDTQLPRTRFVNTFSWGYTDASQNLGGDAFNFAVHELNLRSDLRQTLAPWVTLIGGIDATWARYAVDATFPPVPEDGAPTGPYFARPSRSIDLTAYVLRPALYAGFELSPVPELKLLPSVRADYIRETEEFTFDPRFGARWDVVRAPLRTTLKGAVGLFHQPPMPEESIEPVGTEDIESSQALQTSAGIEQELLPRFTLEVEGFYKWLSELVVARADESRIIGARFVNTGEGRVYGAEVLLRYQGDGPFYGWLAYTLSRSERRNDADLPFTTFEFDQTHILSVVGNVDLGAGWSTGARFRYVTGTPYTPYAGGNVDLDAGAYSPFSDRQRYSARLAPFHQLDLRIEKRWLFEAWSLAAYLELRNAYNRSNPEAMSYNYDYSRSKPVSGLPILPVLGVRGEL